MRDIVDEEGLDDYIKLGTEVTSAVWNEEKSRWIVQSRQAGSGDEVREEEFHFLANASGFLK